MNKVDYFTKAESWAVSSQVADSRSKRTAWIVAGVAAGIAMLEAVALAMLLPLKTVQPITVLVDRQTGHVQAVDPLRPSPVAADEALTQSFLAQYVTARESFDRATVSADYRRVALWSAGRARTGYLAEMPASNPASPFQRYPGGTVVSARVKSVSMLHDGTALVRFDTVRQDPSGAIDTGQPWVAVIRYRFASAPMQMQDRLINPLGFQVVSYRRDAEAPPAAAPAPQTQPGAAPVPGNAVGALQLGAAENRAVPLDQLPLGSPLGLGGP